MNDPRYPFDPRRLSLAARAALRDSTGNTVTGEANMLRALAKRGITRWAEPGVLTAEGLLLAETFRAARAGGPGRHLAYVLRDAEEGLRILGDARARMDISSREIGRQAALGGAAHPSRWFRGEVMPLASTFVRLANLLGYDVALVPRR